MKKSATYVLIALLFSLAGCSAQDSSVPHAAAQYDRYGDVVSEAPDDNDVDLTIVDAADVEQPEFTDCTDDCSGHEAGFQWAQSHDFVDESDCGGNSESFIEGCQAFVEARREAASIAEDEAADDAKNVQDDEGSWR